MIRQSSPNKRNVNSGICNCTEAEIIDLAHYIISSTYPPPELGCKPGKNDCDPNTLAITLAGLTLYGSSNNYVT